MSKHILYILSNIIEYFTNLAPIVISIIALVISLKSRSSEKREERPRFSLVQNLWTKEPYFELINEADSKLDRNLNPTYLMYIPSKLYFHFKDGHRQSILTLSPISYEVITEQIVTGKTKDQIVTSKLPACFFGKKGDRDLIWSEILYQDKNMCKYVVTYPFLVIVGVIDYKYQGKEETSIIISTSFHNVEIKEVDLKNLIDYTKDNAKHEIKLSDNIKNIYQEANNQVFEAVKNMKENQEFFGGKKDGYGFILKQINSLISPKDVLNDRY